MDERPTLTTRTRILRLRDGSASEVVDDLATEEPLEIRLLAGAHMQRAGVTMRTPGADFELAAGFLFSEGVIAGAHDVTEMSYCVDPDIDAEQRYNIVNVRLARTSVPDVERLERHFTAGSACGICGKATIDALAVRAQRIESTLRVSSQLLCSLPAAMQHAQRVFASTGGLHAAALFDENGALAALREDVGRHNALDKLIGWALLNARLPLQRHIIFVSGRASYELVQKCIIAGAPVLCAVSAPSSLAVALAREFNVTLAGFVREGRANVYSAPERLADPV